MRKAGVPAMVRIGPASGELGKRRTRNQSRQCGSLPIPRRPVAMGGENSGWYGRGGITYSYLTSGCSVPGGSRRGRSSTWPGLALSGRSAGDAWRFEFPRPFASFCRPSIQLNFQVAICANYRCPEHFRMNCGRRSPGRSNARGSWIASTKRAWILFGLNHGMDRTPGNCGRRLQSR